MLMFLAVVSLVVSWGSAMLFVEALDDGLFWDFPGRRAYRRLALMVLSGVLALLLAGKV